MKSRFLKLGLVLLLLAVIVLFFTFDLQDYATLGYIKEEQKRFAEFYLANKFFTIALFGVGYIAVTALSLPGAAILTLLSGALFGLGVGTLIVSPASTIGATLAFLISRFLLRETVSRRFKEKVEAIDMGVKKEGAFYLFALRLVPVFPFFMINILMGLTPIKISTFFTVSLAGMLPATLVYVYAGTQLASLAELSDILSPSMLAAFVLLGLLPLVTKKSLSFLRQRRTA